MRSTMQALSLLQIPGQSPPEPPKEALQAQPKKKRKTQPAFGLGFLQDMLEDVRKEALGHNRKITENSGNDESEVQHVPEEGGACEQLSSDGGEDKVKDDVSN